MNAKPVKKIRWKTVERVYTASGWGQSPATIQKSGGNGRGKKGGEKRSETANPEEKKVQTGNAGRIACMKRLNLGQSKTGSRNGKRLGASCKRRRKRKKPCQEVSGNLDGNTPRVGLTGGSKDKGGPGKKERGPRTRTIGISRKDRKNDSKGLA